MYAIIVSDVLNNRITFVCCFSIETKFSGFRTIWILEGEFTQPQQFLIILVSVSSFVTVFELHNYSFE